VDPRPLRDNVRAALRRVSQVRLAEIVTSTPLQHGLAELVTYLSLRDETFRLVYDDQHTDDVTWAGADGLARTATLPRVTFTRAGTS
jgi:hypothetical protein